MTDFFDYILIELLPFWQQFFELVSSVAWPVALSVVFIKIRPLIAQMFSERGFSFEGFGAHLRVEERLNAQAADSARSKPVSLGGNLQLPRTQAIDEEEKKLVAALEQIPDENHAGIMLNALAIERLEKGFLLIYLNIFGSQMTLLQKINERGGSVAINDVEEFFSEVKSKFPELSDWGTEKYLAFLVSHGLLTVSDSVKLTALGKDFILFIVRYSLVTEKAL